MNFGSVSTQVVLGLTAFLIKSVVSKSIFSTSVLGSSFFVASNAHFVVSTMFSAHCITCQGILSNAFVVAFQVAFSVLVPVHNQTASQAHSSAVNTASKFLAALGSSSLSVSISL
jgi:hypothetical protein